MPPEGCTCIHPTHHLGNRSYSLTRCDAAPLWTTNKAHRIASASFSRNVNDAMKDVGAGRRRRISRRLIGHWPHNGRAQQQDSSWKPLVAAEGTKGGCRRAWTAYGRSWRGRDRARCRAPCNVTVTVTKIAAATRARPPYATTRTPPCRAQPWDGVCWYDSVTLSHVRRPSVAPRPVSRAKT